MTKEWKPAGLHKLSLVLLVAIYFQAGCSTTAQPTQPSPATSAPATPPAPVVESHPPETTIATAPFSATEADATDSIFFSLGSSTVSQGERAKLLPIAQQLKEDKDLTVTLNGQSNDNGSRSFNLAIADARVEAVSRILRQLGVKAQQIRKRVVGDESLLHACRTTHCRQQMRRVELLVAPAREARAD